MSHIEPPEETVSNEEMLARLKHARELAWKAGDSASLTPAQRRKAELIARSLTEEIERILLIDLAQRSSDYDDVATVMPDLIQPLRDAKRDIENIIGSVRQIREYAGVIDRLLAVALKFAV
ncbi:MAG: hypothetical protein AAGA70_18175 [Pseudomonadota bacterium]